MTVVVQYLEKWVNNPDELATIQVNYNATTAHPWSRRRKIGLEWVKSQPDRAYIKEVYNTYAVDVETVMKGTERNTIGKALAKYIIAFQEA